MNFATHTTMLKSSRGIAGENGRLEPDKPIHLICCGSFSPVTIAHLYSIETAKDYCTKNNIPLHKVTISPVCDHYKKNGLLPSVHRIKMLELATEGTEYVEVSSWEATQPSYTRTILVLEKFQQLDDELPTKPKVMFLCGADLLDSFNIPGVWSDSDVL
jgi:nicotinamide mononucleotide adenylyltransferase